jgi:predicted TIM-barrel fold metal-dependent hydrolase
VLLPPRSLEPTGRSRYWPILRAAAEADLPIGMHVGGVNGHPVAGSGWPSFYFEEHHANAQMMQGATASLVLEGCFERFPNLKVVLVEGGFVWAASLSWRMDQHWRRMRDEVPHLKRPPSEYLREHVWFTTQPLDEPTVPSHLPEVMSWIGYDRLLFSTDYPHWDYDDPSHIIDGMLTLEHKEMIMHRNAKALFKLA